VLKDSENLKRIEALRPRMERLREAKIRNDAEAERLKREIAEARKAAVELAGTDDLNEIRKIISDNYAANTAAIDEFEKTLAEVEAELDAIERQDQ